MQALVNVSADVADENEARIAFTHADMVDGQTIAISAIYLIARTVALVDLLIAVFIRRAIAVGEAFYFEAARGVADVARLTLAASRVIQNGANGI